MTGALRAEGFIPDALSQNPAFAEEISTVDDFKICAITNSSVATPPRRTASELIGLLIRLF